MSTVTNFNLIEAIRRLKLLLEDVRRLNAEGKHRQLEEVISGALLALEQKGF